MNESLLVRMASKKARKKVRGQRKGRFPYPCMMPPRLSVLITFTLLNRVVAQPCDTALICPGCPLPSRKVPLSR